MNILPISQNMQNNYSVKKSTAFKGEFTDSGLFSVRYWPEKNVEDIISFIKNDASEEVIADGFGMAADSFGVVMGSGGDNITVAVKSSEASVQGLKIGIQKAFADTIKFKAKCGEMSSDFISRLKSYFPKDENINNVINDTADECSRINTIVANEKAVVKQREAELARKEAEQESKKETKKEAAFKTVFPILSALGLYGVFKNGKLAEKALQKAVKVIK